MHDATTMGRRYLSVTLLGVLLYTAEPVAAASLPIPQPWLQQRSAKPRRCLPQLLCIGTQKGGTTSWHDYLLDGYHPRMHVPRARKELHYFDWCVYTGTCTHSRPMTQRRFVEHNASAQHYFAQFPLTAPGDNPLRDRCAALPRDEDGNVKNEIHVQTEATPRCVLCMVHDINPHSVWHITDTFSIPWQPSERTTCCPTRAFYS